MAKSTQAKAPSKAQMEAAAKEQAARFDNHVKHFNVESMLKAANDANALSIRSGTTAEQTAAAICLVHYSKTMGLTSALAGAMAFLSAEAVGSELFARKRRGEFMSSLMNELKMNNKRNDSENALEHTHRINSYNATFKLLGRGLDFACMLIASTGDDKRHHIAPFVLTWFNEKTSRFDVEVSALLTKGAFPMYDLDALAKANTTIPLDGASYCEKLPNDHGTFPAKIVDFVATPKRIKEAAATKLQSAIVPQRNKPPGTTGSTTQGTNQANGNRPSGNTDTPGAGRPEGSASDGAGKVSFSPLQMIDAMKQAGLKQLLNGVVTIMKQPVQRTGKPEDYYWSNDPSRDFIAEAIRVLTSYRDDAMNWEANHREKLRATNLKMMPLPNTPALSVPTKAEPASTQAPTPTPTPTAAPTRKVANGK